MESPFQIDREAVRRTVTARQTVLRRITRSPISRSALRSFTHESDANRRTMMTRIAQNPASDLYERAYRSREDDAYRRRCEASERGCRFLRVYRRGKFAVVAIGYRIVRVINAATCARAWDVASATHNQTARPLGYYPAIGSRLYGYTFGIQMPGSSAG